MPTRDVLASFFADYDKLTTEQKALFLVALAHFIADLKAGTFRKGLRVKKMAGHSGIWEMTWDGDGRATFEYGPEQVPGEKHIVWRRIGSHDIFKQP
jgi:hypothetical protein